MKWFKHFSDASEDEVLSAVIDEFGVEGYGAFWLLVEAISRQIENDPRDSVEYSEKKWRKVTGFSTKKLRKFLTFLEKTHRVLVNNSEKEGKTYLDVRIPKIIEIADEYTKKRLRKALKSTPNIQTNSGACPKKNPLDKIRLDKIRKDNTTDIDKIMINYQKKFPEQRKLFGLGGIIRAREYFEGCHIIGWTYPDILNAIEKATVSEPWKIITISDKKSKAYAKEWKNMVERGTKGAPRGRK